MSDMALFASIVTVFLVAGIVMCGIGAWIEYHPRPRRFRRRNVRRY